MSCVSFLKGLCITPLQDNFSQSLEQSRHFSVYLKGNWSAKVEQLSKKLRLQIAKLNGTRMDPFTLGDFASWITIAFSFFKEWARMLAWGGQWSSWVVSSHLAIVSAKKRACTT
jgi:hypothetical protein